MKSLYEKHIKNNPNFSSLISELTDNNLKRKFLRNFKKEKNEVNFFSHISELKFAVFLTREGLIFEHEPKIQGKTPDFLIHTDNKINLICDVKRFNISTQDESDKKIIRALTNKLKNIKIRKYILITQLKRGLTFDLESLFNTIHSKLLNKELEKKGDCYNHNNELEISILIENEGINNNLLCLTHWLNPSVNLIKLKSIVREKINSYSGILNNNSSFFIGIDLTFSTQLDPSDYWKIFNGYSAIEPNGQKSFDLGEFYTNYDFKNLSGILILFNENFYWLENKTRAGKIRFLNAISDLKEKSW